MIDQLNKKLPLSGLLKATFILLFWVLLYLVLTRFRNILYPICLGILFAFLLRPIMLFLIKKNFPRILSVFISLICGIVVVYGSIFFISNQISSVIQNSPELEHQALENLNSTLNYVNEVFDVGVTEQKNWLRTNLNALASSWTNTLNKAVGATTQTIFTLGILPVYVFFFLYFSNRFKNFFLLLFSSEKKINTESILRQISYVTQKYMSGMFLVVIILAVVNSLGFYLIGLKHPILFGTIAAILNFIPYFGTIFGFSIPFSISLVIMDSPAYAIKILIMFFIVQFSENNLLTPNIVGNKLKINPLAIIIGVLFGGSVWGLPGMFAVVPVIAMIKIICMSIPQLNSWGYLLGVEKLPEKITENDLPQTK